MMEHLKVLLVDRDPGILSEISEVLISRGFDVATAFDGESALEKFRNEKYDVVVIDNKIDGISGCELCNIVKLESSASVSVVMATSREDVTGRLHGFECGADDYIYRPYDIMELLSRLKVVYREHHPWFDEEPLATITGTSENSVMASLEILVLQVSRAAEFRLERGSRHIERMSRYTEIMARIASMDVDPGKLRLAAMFHDIGKMFVPEKLLMKPGPLDEGEMEVVRTHPRRGGEILSAGDDSLMKLAFDIARSHHEWFDGTGYPAGLSGMDIPAAGRLVAVADVFDTVTNERPYGKAISFDRAIAMIRDRSGSQFDPEFADVLREAVPHLAAIRESFPDY